MHNNQLIFLLACRTCTVHVLQARRWTMTDDYEGEENYLRWWSRIAELTVMLVTVLGGVAVADGGSRRRCCSFFFFPVQRPPFSSLLSSLSLLCLSSSSSFSVPPAFFLKFPFCFTPKTLLFHLLVRSFFFKQKSSSPYFLILPPSSMLSSLSLLCLSNKSPPPLLFSPSSPSPSLFLSFSFLLFHSPVSLFRFLLFSSSSTPPLSFSSLPYSSFFFSLILPPFFPLFGQYL